MRRKRRLIRGEWYVFINDHWVHDDHHSDHGDDGDDGDDGGDD